MTKRLDFILDEEQSGRLDSVVASLLGDYSRSRIAKLIEQGNIFVNGNRAKPSKQVKEADDIAIILPDNETLDVVAQDIPLDIVYQDEYLAVINKQQGLTVHPSGNQYKDTLVNALLYHIKDLSGINGVLRPGIVHRLDKNTSGLMVVAKCDKAHIALAEQIKSKECKRIYYALLEGILKQDEGTVDIAIARSKTARQKMVPDVNGRSAVTHFQVLTRYERNTLVCFELQTGRTHQIRVHAKYLGHPVVGDDVYGYKNQRFALNGQLLHSKIIQFTHPVTGETMRFESELPSYFTHILDILEKEKL